MTRNILAMLAAAVAALSAGLGRAAHIVEIRGAVGYADEGLILGNGDLSCSLYQDNDELVFRLGKGDVWDRRMDFSRTPRPADINEYIRAVLVERWKCGSSGQNVKPLAGTSNERRMRELTLQTPVLDNFPYPMPKPVGEFRIRLPQELPGTPELIQRLIVEEGRIVVAKRWPCGVEVDVEAVVAPDENVFSAKWEVRGWNDATRTGRPFLPGINSDPPVKCRLWRWQDPDALVWSAERRRNRDGMAMYGDWRKFGDKFEPLPAPVLSWKKGSGRFTIEQPFHPDNIFPQGFRCRMTFDSDPRRGEVVGIERLAPLKDAIAWYVPGTNVFSGSAQITVTTSSDQTLEAPRPTSHVELAAAAKAHCAAFWRRSAISIPGDRELEDLWYSVYHARHCILKPGTVPPGLYFPSAIRDYVAWNGDYHANYNMQSIYWGDFAANRLEEAETFCEMIEKWFVPLGRKIAKDYYHCRGVFIQLSGTPTAPDEDVFGHLPIGRLAYMTGWAMTHFWQYYLYTLDRDFLEKRAWPLMRDVALFYTDFLKKAPHKDLPPELSDGKYHAFPSVWGEAPLTGDWRQCCDKAQVMAHIRYALAAAIQASEILGKDQSLRDEWKERLENLAYVRRNLTGRDRLAYENCVPEFSYVGQAYRRPPEKAISPAKRDNEWYYYPGHNWSGKIRAMRENRFVPSRDFHEYRECLRKWAHRNGIVNAMAVVCYGHPGGWTESLSCMAPLQEMLMSSWDGAIRLFPFWKADMDVAFRNFRAEGAFLVSAGWKNGRPAKVEIFSEKGGTCRVWGDWDVADGSGNRLDTMRDDMGRLCFSTTAGCGYSLKESGK